MTWYRYVGYKPLKGSSASCGDFEEVTTPAKGDVLYALPDAMSGSDYSGSSYNYSNYRVFLGTFKSFKGVYDIYGGYGTYGVAIRESLINSNKDIQHTLKSLEEYPLLDDQDQSNLEVEWADEAWKSWARDDSVKFLRVELDNEDWEPSDESDFRFQFECASQEANENWESENNTVYIHTDRVLPYLLDIILVRETSRENLGELATREWKSSRAVEEFNARLKLRELPQVELPLLLDKDWEYASVQRDFEDRCKYPDLQLRLPLQVPLFQAVMMKEMGK